MSFGILFTRCKADAQAAIVACATAATVGCGGGDEGTGGAGAGPPQHPEDVPAEAIDADPATACPEAYQSSSLEDGLNGDYEIAGQVREVFLILPDASHEGPRPMFMAFNGTNESGPSFSDRARLTDFAERGFLVVAPSSAGNGTVWPVWDAMHAPGEPDVDNPDLALADSLIQCVGAHHSVDRNRLYLGGHSAGGIMSNYLLQRRSDVFAGGIVASGVFSLTSPEDPQLLSPTFALVTWGGDNDEYSGGTSNVSVPEINFVEQASLASTFYDAEPDVGQAHCYGPDIGHAWLDEVNDTMVDQLLAHPNGLPGADGVDIPESPGAGVTCSPDPFELEGGLTVICPTESAVSGCAETCQLFADCAVENATVGPVLEPQLTEVGFSGPDNTDCSGCVTKCEATATEPADAQVLSCFRDAAESAQCGPGIEGALPAIDAINNCCEGQHDSAYCVELCTIMLTNSSAAGFLPECEALVSG